MFLDMSGTGEPHRGLGRLFVRKRTRWPHLWARTPCPSCLMEPRPQGRHVHAMHPSFHVARPLGPRRPRHPRPQHCPWTFSDMENCAHGSPCRTVPMRTIRSSLLLFRAKNGLCMPRRQRRRREACALETVGGIRPRQVPWMISARSCSRRLLGLGGPGLTPPCPRHRRHAPGWQ